MDYFFTSRDKVRRFGTAPDGIDLDGLRYVTRERALKDGTPFFLGSDMRPLEPHCSFFLDLAKTLKAKSLQDYTYDFLDFSDFLESLDPPSDVLSATEDDLLAYREHCTEHRDEPMSPATWKRRRVTIHNFYDWAVDEAKLLARRPYYRRPNGRDVLSWGSTAALDVRHLTYEQWRFLDHVGLRGLLPDGKADPSFRSSHTLRDSAVGNLSITTGLRLREFRALLDIEVGPPRRDGTAKEVELQAIAKFGLPRTVEPGRDASGDRLVPPDRARRHGAPGIAELVAPPRGVLRRRRCQHTPDETARSPAPQAPDLERQGDGRGAATDDHDRGRARAGADGPVRWPPRADAHQPEVGADISRRSRAHAADHRGARP